MSAGPRIPEVLVAGDPRHGVTRAARELRAEVSRLADTDPGRVHVHFTDRLHGRDADEAARWFERLAASRPVTATLHDLPQDSDGTSYDARARCYRRVAGAARGVVCNSEHERALLADLDALAPGGPVAVVPLPMPHVDPPATRPEPGPEAGVLGWFYPGKGHADVVHALAGLPPGRPSLAVLGAASPGHEGELEDLLRDAARAGVPAEVSGYLSDEELVRRCRRVAVPVVAHQHVSASGSLNTWVAAGRRPLVRDGRYAREIAALRPGTSTLYAPHRLAEAVAAALEDPASTWLGDDAVLAPHPEDVAAAYVAWWTREVAW